MKKKPAQIDGSKVATDTEASDAEARQAIIMLAATIKCDRDFILLLVDSDPALRQQVYEMIAPHVSYSPRPFALMSFEADA